MEINRRLSLAGCWGMVNRIESASDPNEVRRRCIIAEEWLKANIVISDDDFDDLMRAVSYIYRESYHN